MYLKSRSAPATRPLFHHNFCTKYTLPYITWIMFNTGPNKISVREISCLKQARNKTSGINLKSLALFV